MAKQRSGIPSGADSGDLQDLFGNSGSSAKPGKGSDSEPVAADGWPSWMGDADQSLAPAKPPAAKPKPQAEKTAARPVAARPQAATSRPAVSAQVLTSRSAPPPTPASAPGTPRRWLRSLICGCVIALAFIAGEVAARYRPEAAVGFQQTVANVSDHLPAAVPPIL